ncbi:MAG: PEP-CTERM sorting domain-containing protein [Thermoguttaceae bacterium]|jgi:hypothetical protein
MDITTGSIAVDYVYDTESDTGELIAHSKDFSCPFPQENSTTHYWIWNYDDNGDIDNFYLDMFLDSKGNLKAGTTSTLSYTGDMWDPDFASILVPGKDVEQPLLTATLSQFGFTDAGEQLDFIFNVTGGNLQTPEYYPTQVGMWMHSTGFDGNWADSFHDESAPDSDLFNIVPEPSCWVLLSTLIIGGWMAYRRKTG